MFERDLFVMINSVFRKVGIINILFKCIRYLVIFVFGRMWNIIKYKLKLWRSFMNSIWKKRKRKWVDIKVIYKYERERVNKFFFVCWYMYYVYYVFFYV